MAKKKTIVENEYINIKKANKAKDGLIQAGAVAGGLTLAVIVKRVAPKYSPYINTGVGGVVAAFGQKKALVLFGATQAAAGVIGVVKRHASTVPGVNHLPNLNGRMGRLGNAPAARQRYMIPPMTESRAIQTLQLGPMGSFGS